MSPQERAAYKSELKAMRDLNTQFYFEREEGRAEGRAEERRIMVLSMAQEGLPIVTIAKIAKTSISEVKKILDL